MRKISGQTFTLIGESTSKVHIQIDVPPAAHTDREDVKCHYLANLLTFQNLTPCITLYRHAASCLSNNDIKNSDCDQRHASAYQYWHMFLILMLMVCGSNL